jgi:hypothetical protein
VYEVQGESRRIKKICEVKKMTGESAVEFLMTYGWAILIVVVVVGALFVMGVFNPEAFTGTKSCEHVFNKTQDNCNVTCDCVFTCLDVTLDTEPF